MEVTYEHWIAIIAIVSIMATCKVTKWSQTQVLRPPYRVNKAYQLPQMH